MHGYGDSAKRFAYYTGLHNVASKNDVIIYPQANKPSKDQKSGWNADFCCGSGWNQSVDDSGFIAMLIKKVKQDNNLADSKVFVAGFSNGAFLSQKIAIDHPDLIDDVAVVSGSIGTQNMSFKPKVGIPIILKHGARDETIPLNGGF